MCIRINITFDVHIVYNYKYNLLLYIIMNYTLNYKSGVFRNKMRLFEIKTFAKVPLLRAPEEDVGF